MKKILITLMVFSFIGLSVNAQTAKVKQAKTSPVTTASLIKDFTNKIITTSMTKSQQANCREYYIWSLTNKERIIKDSTLSAVDKQNKINSINNTINDRFSKLMDANDLKIMAPFIK